MEPVADKQPSQILYDPNKMQSLNIDSSPVISKSILNDQNFPSFSGIAPPRSSIY